MAAGGRGHRPYGDASPINDHRTLEAPLATVHRAPSCLLSPAGRFRDAAIDRQLREIQADGPIVGFERHLAQPLDHPKLDPLVATIPKRGRRAGTVGDLLVGATEHQNLHQLLEDDPVSGIRGRWQPKGWLVFLSGREALNCWKTVGSMMYGGTAGTGTLLREA